MESIGDYHALTNHNFPATVLVGAVGATLGWVKPGWFGSAGQAAAMAAISHVAVYSVGFCSDRLENKDERVFLVALAAGLFTPKGLSLGGFEATWMQTLTLGTMGTLAGLFASTSIKSRHLKTGISPVIWTAVGYGACKLFSRWITPIDGATMLGVVSATDLLLLHDGKPDPSLELELSSFRSGSESCRASHKKYDGALTLNRALVGVALAAVLTAVRHPSNWKPFALCGVFYGQRALSDHFTNKKAITS